MFSLFALTLVTAGLGVYYRDSCQVPYACLGHSGLLLYVVCNKSMCPVNHTAIDLRECKNTTGPTNESDTWLDSGCAFLGGGCTRRFVKSSRDDPWCVPVELDSDGQYAPVVRVDTTRCRIECDQDYGVLNENGTMSCACPPPSPQTAAKQACESKITNKVPDNANHFFCQSPLPCNSTSCSCIPQDGVMAITIDLKTGKRNARAAYDILELFPVSSSTKEGKCPVGWHHKKADGYGIMALANGFRFLRPSNGIFYQPIGLPIATWRPNSCVCLENCQSNFPKILCVLPGWFRQPMRCIPSSYLEKPVNITNKILSVTWKNKPMAEIGTSNNFNWTCVSNHDEHCQFPSTIPLKSSPECLCLSSCTPSLCPCGARHYRLFKYYDSKRMDVGLCRLSMGGTRSVWALAPCQGKTDTCHLNATMKKIDFFQKKAFSLGYHYYTDQKFLRPLSVKRPLQKGECVCVDKCYEGTPYLQCRLDPDPDLSITRCEAPMEAMGGIGEEIVLAKDIPNLSSDSDKARKSSVIWCNGNDNVIQPTL